MRGCSSLRDKNGVVALRLLPVFEEYPHGWNAVPRLPVSTESIVAYIEAWKASVQGVDRRFAERVGAALTVDHVAACASGRSCLRLLPGPEAVQIRPIAAPAASYLS